MKAAKLDLQDIVHKEEIMWKQCSRDKWIRERDGNASYFHHLANGRRMRNLISSIKTGMDRNDSPENILSGISSHYKALFARDKLSFS